MSGRNTILGAAAIAMALSVIAMPAFARGGVISTSSGEPIGKPVDQVQRVLRVGLDVFANERITTTANDRAQLLFVDGSTLSIGPNSELTLDRYFFDPAKSTGTIAISAGRGVLRLVGGAITKDNEATIRTPSGTIGIRGGITIVEITGPTQTNAYFVFGRGMRGDSEGRDETATRPSSAITLRAGREPAGRGAPIEQRMAQSQISRQNSGNPDATLPRPGPGTGSGGPPSQPGQHPIARQRVCNVFNNMPTPAQLPTVGTAIYNGRAVGTVLNGASRYNAIGTFQPTWYFSYRIGSVSINNFDGINYAGSTSGSPANVSFIGLVTDSAGRSGIVAGSFFKSPSDPAAYKAGTFSVASTDYKATGTFAGRR